MANVERFIARRYLLSKRKLRFINVIGIVSVAGLTVGVAALLVALSVFNGFNGVVTSVLVGFDPHLRIEKKGGMTPEEVSAAAAVLKADPDIKAFAPFVSGKAMLATRGFTQVAFVRRLDEASVGGVSGLNDRIVLGSVALGPQGTAAEEGGARTGIVVGMALADRLAAVVGNNVTLYGPSGIQSALTGMSAPQGTAFAVSGIYESNNKEYDANYAWVSLAAAQELFGLGEKVNGIEVRCADFHEAETVRDRIAGRLSSGYVISTWYDLHKSLYNVMRIERWSAYVLLCLIVVVATFNTLGSLTMGVIEKRRDIAVLRSMGMTAGRISRIFMAEGLLIGVAGTIFGMLLGLAVLWLQVKYGIFPLDPTVYIIPAIPVELRWTDFAAITAASLGLSCAAAYYPAGRAAASRPSEELRWE